MASKSSMSGRMWRAAGLTILLTMVSGIALPARAFAASSYVPPIVVSSANAVAASGLPGDLGDVALDACGNIYTINAGSGQLVEIPYSGGAATTVLGANSYGTMSLWIDAAKANLFVLQGYTGTVTDIPLTDCVPNTSAETSIGIGNLGAISYYWGGSAEATDASDDLFIATNGACCANANELLEQYATSTNDYTTGTVLLSSLANPIVSIAVDSSGNIYYADSSGALYKLPVTTAATSSSPAVYSATPVSFGSGYTNVVGVAIDSTGNLYVADGGASTIYEIPYETTANGSALNPSDQFIVAAGVNISNTPAVGDTGTLYFADQGSSVDALTRFSAEASPTTVGSSGTVTLSAAFGSATTLGSFPGYPNSGSFTQTGGTCTAGNNYAAGASCTLILQFSPTVPGISNGGVEILSSSGRPLATIYLSGTGLGPGLTIDPGLVTAAGGGFNSPEAVAIDAAGDTFYADPGNNSVLEFKPGSTTPIDIGTGLSEPAGVAVDGAGDVLIADTGNNRIVEVPMVNGALSNSAQTALPTTLAGEALQGPTGIAVDGAGDLFIADTGNNRVVAVPYNGSWNSSAATVVASSLDAPLAVASAPSGNLYVANSGAGQIDEILSPLSQPISQLVAVGFAKPSGLAVDASGSLFVADPTDGELVRIPNLSGSLSPNDQVEAGIGINAPYGVAIDPAGNLYVSDSSAAAAYEVARTSTTLDFGNWAVGATSGLLSAEVENEGNQPLNLSTPWYGLTGNTGDFSISAAASVSCASGSQVATGDNCELDATFTPAVSGSLSAVLTVASDATNASPVQVSLSGSGGTATTTTTTLAITSPASGAPFFGQPITFSVTVTASTGTPSGSVTLLVDGIQTGVATLNSGGTASFTLGSGLTGGTHSALAIYDGSSGFSGSVSQVLQLSVTKAPTTTTLTVDPPFTNPDSALPGSTVTMTAAVQSTGVGIPTGTVTFTAGGRSLGSAPLLPATGGGFAATLSTTALATGSDAIVAAYSGDSNYIQSSSAPTTVTVVSSPQVTIASSGTSLTSSTSGSSTINFTTSSYGGWEGLVGFSCEASSLPANARCVFSPGQTQVTPSTAASPGTNPPVSLSVAIDQPPQSPTASGFLWWLAGPAGLLLFFARRRFARHLRAPLAMIAALVLLGIAGLGLGACGGSPQNLTPAGTSTVTVYAWAQPFSTPPTSSNENPGTATCPDNNPASAPCSQTTFQVSLTVK